MKILALIALLLAATSLSAQDLPQDCGPKESLKLVQETPGAVLYSDRGFGSKTSPRRYCLAWKGVLSNVDMPMLVFITPTDGKYPPYPQGGVRLTRLPIDPPQDQIPYNVWAYPAVEPVLTWGMYAATWHVDPGTDSAKSVRPIMWWGRLKTTSFDSVPVEKVNGVIANMKLPKR